jgi:hypothetical protein
MYPQRQLIVLAERKARLRHLISRRRHECADAVAHIARPLAWLDSALTVWRRLVPFAAVPLGILAGRTLFPRRRLLGALVRWGPAVFGAVRGLKSAFRNR